MVRLVGPLKGLSQVTVNSGRRWAIFVLFGAVSCSRREVDRSNASIQHSTLQGIGVTSATVKAAESITDVSSLPVIERCDDNCRVARKASEFDITAGLLRAVLTRRGNKNTSFSPVVLVAPNEEWMVPSMPVALGFAMERHPGRFVGVDGASFRHSILYIDHAVPCGSIQSNSGSFEVFQPPVSNSDYVLSIVLPPQVAVGPLARSVDSVLLRRLLEMRTGNEKTLALAQPVPALNFPVTKLLTELEPEVLKNIKQDSPVNIPFELVGGGAVTGFLRIRSHRAIGRPTWFFLQNAEGELLVVAVINSSPTAAMP